MALPLCRHSCRPSNAASGSWLAQTHASLRWTASTCTTSAAHRLPCQVAQQARRQQWWAPARAGWAQRWWHLRRPWRRLRSGRRQCTACTALERPATGEARLAGWPRRHRQCPARSSAFAAHAHTPPACAPRRQIVTDFRGEGPLLGLSQLPRRGASPAWLVATLDPRVRLLLSRRSWSFVQQGLADALRASVTAHDMPGFGLSQR